MDAKLQILLWPVAGRTDEGKTGIPGLYEKGELEEKVKVQYLRLRI
jgi:hypothetical protein